jgi:hypothetical protein
MRGGPALLLRLLTMLQAWCIKFNGETLKFAAASGGLKISAAKENWLARQVVQQAGATRTEGTASTNTRAKRYLPPCTLGINSSNAGEWTQLSDRTLVYNLKDCELHQFTAQEAQQCLSNVHLFFVGDSVTRFQYLSLVHLLANGNYPDRRIQLPKYSSDYAQNGQPNILRDADYHHKYHLKEDGKSKVKFLHESALFLGNELCDCWDGNATMSSSVEKNVENRFYQLDGLNLSVSFVKKLGFYMIHGHNLTSFEPKTLTPKSYDQNAYDQWSYDWNPKTIEVAVEETLQKMPKRKQQRQVVIWNDGVWGYGNDNLADMKQSLRKLASSVGAGGQVLFKTTTVNHLETFEEKSYLEYSSIERTAVKELRAMAGTKQEKIGLWDTVSDTGGLGIYDLAVATAHFEHLKNKSSPEYAEVYLDAVHFQPYVYNEMNKLLLNQICAVTAAGGR